ncbi:MAG: hypothetical protein J3K34DRAFT_516727 [Monoraphidium minutum]|nr:MAG: hypothetical protein J3K34DRAFT_516727 [Monoraphidium minutum]
MASKAAGRAAGGAAAAAGAPPANWAVPDVRAFYRAFHEHGPDWEQVAAAVGGGKGAGDCEHLHSLYTTFLGLPHSAQLEDAFSAMVADMQRAAANAAANGGGGDEPMSDGGGDGSAPVAAGGRPPRHGVRRKPGASQSESTPPAGAGARRGAAARRGGEEGEEGEDGMEEDDDDDGGADGEEEEEDGEEEGEEEDPSAADEDASQGGGRKRRAAGTGTGGGASASAGGDDGESLAARRPKRARRSRKLFGESSSDGDSQAQRARQQRQRQREPRGGLARAAAGADVALQDDIGEGIDALLSLASIAHAAQSGDDDDDDDGGGYGGEGGGYGGRMARTPRKPTPGDLSQGSPSGGGMQATRLIAPAVAVRAPTPRKGGRAARTARAKRAAAAAAAARAARAAQAAAAAAGGGGDYGDEDEGLEGVDDDEGLRYDSEGGDYDGPPHPGAAAHIARAKARRTPKPADEGAVGDGIAAARAAAAAAAGLGGGYYGGAPGSGGRGARRAKAAAAAYLHDLATRPDDDGGVGGGGARGGSDDDRRRGGGRRALGRRGSGGHSGGQRLSGLMDGGGRHSKRKSAPERLGSGGAGALSKQASGDPSSYLQAQLSSPAERALRHALGGAKVRRWALSEFHYSSLDRPYFTESDMDDYLAALQLPPGVKLARPEWGALRGALGRPRRLSLAFLRQERARLELYRESVRKAIVDAGGGALPPHMPRPLRVGQAVVSRHPVTRRLADGIILTMQPSRYRVQFNRSDLLTEVVRDTDVAAADPHESLPPALRLPPGSRFAAPRPPPPAGALAAAAAAAGGPGGAAPGGALARKRSGAMAAAAAAAMPLAGGSWPALVTPPIPTVTDAQGRADQELLSRLEATLGRKDALLGQLRDLNAAASAGGHLDAATGRPSDGFQTSYAAALADLQVANSEVAAAMSRMGARRQLNAPLGPMRQALAAQAAAAAAAAAASALPPLPPPGAVDAIVADAAARARAVVRRRRSAAAADASGGEGAGLAARLQQQVDDLALEELISGCIALLLAARLATAPGAGAPEPKAPAPPGGGAAPQMSVAAVWTVLDTAVSRLAPRAPGAASAFAGVRAAVEALKRQLAGFG